jgi:Fe-Mn family superoxide dismutase
MTALARRDLLAGAAALAVATVVTSTAQAADAAPAGAPASGRAYAGRHAPQPLPFDPAKLDGLSEKLVRSHYDNNYLGAIKALNAVEGRLPGLVADKEWPAFLLGEVKREELLRSGSLIMHQHYFGNLGGDGRIVGEVGAALGEWFGSAEAWEAEFRKIALGLGGGSGWAVLSFNLYTGELHNRWAWDHHTGVAWESPLLVCDMYEHAYALDYGAAAAKYVDAFMRNVDWAVVDRRLAVARRLAAALNA